MARELPRILSPNLGCPFILSNDELNSKAFDLVIAVGADSPPGHLSLIAHPSFAGEGTEFPLELKDPKELTEETLPPEFKSIDETRFLISTTLRFSIFAGQARFFVYRAKPTLPVGPEMFRKIGQNLRAALYDLSLIGEGGKTGSALDGLVRHGADPKNLTLVDERKDKDTVPLVIDASKMPLIYDLAEIPEQAEVELRLRTPKPGDPYGSTQHVSGDKFIVRINILPLDKIATEKGPTGSYPDDSLYVINNTVVHELRHVGQHYVYKQMDADYAKELATKGYKGNFYEKEGWLWGHYPDATGKRSTSDDYEGTPMALKQPLQGYAAWAVTPPGWRVPS